MELQQYFSELGEICDRDGFDSEWIVDQVFDDLGFPSLATIVELGKFLGRGTEWAKSEWDYRFLP